MDDVFVDVGEVFAEEGKVDAAAGCLRPDEFVLRVLEVVGDDGGYCGVILAVDEGDEGGEGGFEVFTPECLFVGVAGPGPSGEDEVVEECCGGDRGGHGFFPWFCVWFCFSLFGGFGVLGISVVWGSSVCGCVLVFP